MKQNFSQTLLIWHQDHARRLPWKADRDPYKIWVSEIILQQTRVSQGTPYFLKFLAKFPHVHALAQASEDELMKLWEGLGYYSRARHMHATAKYIVKERKGEFPDSYDELIKLNGIGPYTAAAIASFAFSQPIAVVDGNVIRVLSRIFGVEIPFDTSKGKSDFSSLANELLDPDQPGAFNQAIMDLGATLCTPASPACERCPFQSHCVAFNEDRIGQLPVRSRRLKRKERFFHYMVLSCDDGRTVIQKRTDKDIWKGLYQFPLWEKPGHQPKEWDIPIQELLRSFGYEGKFSHKVAGYEKQVLTHQDIRATFHRVRIACNALSLPDQFYLVDYKNLCNFALPKIIDWFIAKNNII